MLLIPTSDIIWGLFPEIYLTQLAKVGAQGKAHSCTILPLSTLGNIFQSATLKTTHFLLVYSCTMKVQLNSPLNIIPELSLC